MNPFKRLKLLTEAERIMAGHGFSGSIVDMVNQSVGLHASQTQALCDATKTILEAASNVSSGEHELVNPDETTVAYFVPYDVEYSKYHNGGRAGTMKGMTMVHVDGGISNWDQLMGVRHFIQRSAPICNLPNSQVRINGVFELDRWITKEKAK